MISHFPTLPNDAAAIIEAVLTHDRRVLLFGPPGSGKSTLMTALADALRARERSCRCLSADPGSPAFGVPGAITLGTRGSDGWALIAAEPLCTLDAGRFRLPLLLGVRRLLAQTDGMVLIDSPGVVRGVAGSEMLQALVEAAEVDLLLILGTPERAQALSTALPVEKWSVPAAAEARRPGKRARAHYRTDQWDAYLSDAVLQEFSLDRLVITGTPPPLDEPEPWIGRQVALLSQGRCLALGEVLELKGDRLALRAPPASASADALLVRDASRGSDGLLQSAPPFVAHPLTYLPPTELVPGSASDQGPRPAGRIGGVDVALINGLFGDPLLHVRLRHQARSLLFDLGAGGRLSARVAHQVSDVFVSHAHMDHLGGFLWLLRSRIGESSLCRLYGPPGLARNIDSLVRGFLWDRIGDCGPMFQVSELLGERLLVYRLQAGKPGIEQVVEQTVNDGLVLVEPGFRVRATTLDHHTPVIAYAFEPDSELNVRKDRLQASGLSPGTWLTELKQRLRAGDGGAMITLPDGRVASAAEIAPELILVTPGKRLVYATDLADTADNRERLIALARNAHTLFLEAVFTDADIEHARAHGHLTARACGEIAAAAGVARLVPFHFSPRYAQDPQVLLDEIEAACGAVSLPSPTLWSVPSEQS